MSENLELYDNAKYFNCSLRVESNCHDFLKTGKSKKKLLSINIEWTNTFVVKKGEEEEYYYGVFERELKNRVHARAFVLALALGEVNALNYREESYCNEGSDIEEVEEKGEIQKVLFGDYENYHPALSNGKSIIMTYYFDYYGESQ